jgi:hypothetical protein
MHADIHHVYYHPNDYDSVYYVTDGGLFISGDGGETFAGANGRLHCTQFYADFSCSSTDTLFAIGGLQDNATPVYEGNLSWRRVIGGDGLSTAIHPANDSIVYGSSQYLNINKSTDKAQSFNFIANYPGGNVFCFVAERWQYVAEHERRGRARRQPRAEAGRVAGRRGRGLCRHGAVLQQYLRPL